MDTCQLSWQKGNIFAHGLVEYEPLPNFGYPCVVRGRVQFTTDGFVKSDDLQDTYWKVNSDEAEDWKMNLENEEDPTEDIVTDHVKGEESEYSSSKQGEPNRGQVPALHTGITKNDNPDLRVLVQCKCTAFKV